MQPEEPPGTRNTEHPNREDGSDARDLFWDLRSDRQVDVDFMHGAASKP